MRSFWLRAAVLVMLALVVFMVDGSLRRAPVMSLVPIFILVGLWYFFYRKMLGPIFFVDEVFDCEVYLKVRRARMEETVPLSNISKVEVPAGGPARIAVHFVVATPLGQQIDFMPDAVSQAKSWPLKLAELNRLAADLDARATVARGIELV